MVDLGEVGAFALIEAEEHGVTRENVRTLATTTVHPAVERLLGVHGRFGKALGVRNDWVVRVVGSVGNYGEMFERHLGHQSALRLERALNRLWTQGGLMYAPPPLQPEPLEHPVFAVVSLLVLGVMVVLFLVGEQLPRRVVPPAVAIVGASLALLAVYSAKVEPVEHVFKDIDWKTLLFLMCMFTLVQALTKTGILRALMAEMDGVRQGEDRECVHRMRVASRRLHNVLPLFATSLSHQTCARWRK